MRSTDDYLIFYHLIEQGSFSKAADLVGLTKSVVSKRITRLEQDLGVQLLYRTTRKLTLTEAGEVFFAHAREVYYSVQNAEQAMSGLGESLTGTIRITVPTISGELLLPQAIAEFSAKYPDIHIDMDLDNRFVDIVAEGFDLAIRTGALPDSSFIARRLVEAHWVICGAPEYFARQGVPKVPAELTQHNCLAYSYQETGAKEWLFKDDDKPYTLKVDGNFTTNNASALRRAALFGQGLVYVPRVLVAEDLQSGALIEVLQEQVGKRLGIYAIYPYTRHQPMKVKLFIEHLYQCYQKHEAKFSS
ncbi:LysR family transcriptional regulator [Photobacterium jeanii]|uniref:LysR family transcriptional regulator n=1 Tax=Photobacterium jeanii TaxID=858640 RepID=A0A178K3K3_9GAMM|nr:LysR family transcriptional regulator [Photobacterium jeanii]OAN11677.1 LysR family transcriptional regulator [Photobacterium jeanii]PST91211.1 LysR family transcriptional regulator [Photobacterium jeanii]